jgi:3-methylcrotonyl-CoA carboxylase alpha subunit
MIEKLLVANRGEIAIRVMRTAREMGIRTVAVYSSADANAIHVRAADEAYCIGAPPARDSYLNIQAIVDVARVCGATAVHPGYGFLSENAEFAEACTNEGLIFVGPPASAMRAMGLKDRAKEIMQSAGVAVVPGYAGDEQSAARLVVEAGKIGYPVLIKAVAGGGGKGMRYVERESDFEGALESARREAKSAFGESRVLVEKFVSRPRHVEVQIFADSYDECIHLFERDCSLQRRHQKVIEEALAPGMPELMRDAMGAAAVKAAKAVGYVGAGTVEFIVDASEGLRPDRFWFMEMNTRLQVEHPVTECVTGLDLVEWQIRVAAGEHLPLTQSEVSARGHAIEVRLYAEDPDRGFLPSVGQLEYLQFPKCGSGVRIDSAVAEGDYVWPYYDPMIAKIIASAPNRSEAILKLSRVLRGIHIGGVVTNCGFLLRCLSHPKFREGDIDTGFIERFSDILLPATELPPVECFAAATRFLIEQQYGTERASKVRSPWSNGDGFRVGGRARQVVSFEQNGERLDVCVEFCRDAEPRYYVSGSLVKIPLGIAVTQLRSKDIAVMHEGVTFRVRVFDPSVSAESHMTDSDGVLAPTPGKVTAVLVEAGQKVTRGTPLVSIEAMKMEHTFLAPADVTIASVEVFLGDQVKEGGVMVLFDKGSDA